MNQEKMLQNPLPIDRVAARVVRASKPEDRWDPKPKPIVGFLESDEVLRTKSLPKSAPRELLTLTGKRRGRMVVCGYAADQTSGQTASWVVRCDCGKYELRGHILRWLGTLADDMCRECMCRNDRLGRKRSSEPHKRITRETGAAGAMAQAAFLLPAIEAGMV